MNLKSSLTQGFNRQIRRMCEYLNYEVQSLETHPHHEHSFEM